MPFYKSRSASKMTRTVLYLLVFLFFASRTVDGGSRADSNSEEKYYRGERSYGGQHKRSYLETNQKSVSAPAGKNSGGGLGAWGYMAIILTIAGIGTGIYYFILLFPILCKRERKYDVMQMSSV